MPHIKILSDSEKRNFDTPPFFNSEQRKKYFKIDEGEMNIINSFISPKNKIGFILQYKYFKQTNKFYNPKKIDKKDIEYIANHLEIPIDKINFGKYEESTFRRHQQIILKKLGIKRFDISFKEALQAEALNFCSKQLNPRLLFESLIIWLKVNKIEVPSYFILSEIITNTLIIFEKNLVALVNQNLKSNDKKNLNTLLEIDEEYETIEKKDLKIKKYKITFLKKHNHSVRPGKIKENINDLKILNTLYEKLLPIIAKLGLSRDIIRYYAQVLIKSQVFQISRRANFKYLYLICFVIHQYYELNDIIIEKLQQSTQTNINSCLRLHKEEHYEQRLNREKKITKIYQVVDEQLKVLEKIKGAVDEKETDDSYKIKIIQEFISENKIEYNSIRKKMDEIINESKLVVKNADYYNILESKSIKLQNRVSDIVKQISFDEKTSDKRLVKAIEYYKKRDGILGDCAPIDFLDDKEKDMVFDNDKKFKISLYKVLLFEKITEALKSGALSLSDSYKYRTFDDYLIPENIWKEQKEDLLKKAGLEDFISFDKIIDTLETELDNQYKKTNENINSGENKHVKFGTRNKIIVSTPKKEKETEDNLPELFPTDKIIFINEVLSTVNKYTGFSDAFEHYRKKYNREKPDEKTFFAGIIGHGCNIGIGKLARISKNINRNELENTVNWYFSDENINYANNRIFKLIEKLSLKNVFKNDRSLTHTSSDGQKYNIAVDSVNANYSYKYFGKGKGVSIYSFIDDSHRLFHSTVISSSEREAAYVIDGLMNNDVVQSNIHSTDTHGYSEIIFGVSHMLDISFAPRIKGFRDQKLYGFEQKSNYISSGYKIIQDKKIDTQIIKKQWDNILRFIATIKIRKTSASQLFRRLSSYSRQHPLYRAIKEFGKIIKSIFLLKYIDDVELRQAIEKQLNKLESSNKLAKAVFFGNNQEFQYSTKEEQLIAEGCKRLIENAIICWNYLYLTQRIYNCESKQEKDLLIKSIKNSSVVAWSHINLHGEYDFSENIYEHSIKYELKKLLEVSA